MYGGVAGKETLIIRSRPIHWLLCHSGVHERVNRLVSKILDNNVVDWV